MTQQAGIGHGASGARRLFLAFRLGAERYVLDARDIVKVLPLRHLKQLPAVPDWIAGVFAWRGTPVPVIDLAMLALGTPSSAHASTRLVLVNYRRAGRTHVLGLILEHAIETRYLPADAFAADGLAHEEARYLGPVMRDGAAMLQWVRVADMLPAAVHARLFPETEAA